MNKGNTVKRYHEFPEETSNKQPPPIIINVDKHYTGLPIKAETVKTT